MQQLHREKKNGTWCVKRENEENMHDGSTHERAKGTPMSTCAKFVVKELGFGLKSSMGFVTILQQMCAD